MNNNSLHISFVINTLGVGGATKMMMFVAQGLIEQGYRVSIINLNTYGNFDRQQENIETRSSNIVYEGPLKTNYKHIRFVYKQVKDLRPDIIVAFLENSNFCASVVGHLLHIPVIISERGDPFTLYKNPPISVRIKLWVINQADGAVFQTKGASKFYSKRLLRMCAIIPNAIQINETIKDIDYLNRPKTIVTHGSFTCNQKRHDILLQGFKIFLNSHPEYFLKIYGAGEGEVDIRHWINDYGLNGKVILMGKTTTPLESISKEGIYAITSDFEGISNSLLEAMAVGLPVVSTDHSPGGARFLIDDHKNGLLVPIRDPDSLARAFCEFAENEVLAESCGREATKVLERFAPENILVKWEAYIISVVNRYYHNNSLGSHF